MYAAQDPKPIVAFCTTCKGRAQHVELTLPENLRDNVEYSNAKIILVDYNSPDHLNRYIRENHMSSIESGRLVVYRFTEPIAFRMAHAKNLAHRLGMMEGATILVNMDADNYTGINFADYLAEQFKIKPRMFMWSRMVKDGEGRLPRGISGRIAVTSHAFLETGGYDEKFETWSPDDKDFNARLQKMGYEPFEIDAAYLSAILHNDKIRFKEYPHAKATAVAVGEDAFDLKGREDITITNFGRVGMGVVYRNYEPKPIELGLIPTRIFGIGMHKTATTSLHQAFKLLGFNSAHWKSAHWAKAIWEEMKATGKSKTLESSYALCDLPIPLLYQELDQAYPGSKFILTVRNENDWLESVRAHWSQKNPFRSGWDQDPFTHRIHRELYGQKWFDPDIFLARYRRHNAEVLAYFKNRPQDLLVIYVGAGTGWYELCGFLRQPIPSVPYPKMFQTPSDDQIDFQI